MGWEYLFYRAHMVSVEILYVKAYQVLIRKPLDTVRTLNVSSFYVYKHYNSTKEDKRKNEINLARSLLISTTCL